MNLSPTFGSNGLLPGVEVLLHERREAKMMGECRRQKQARIRDELHPVGRDHGENAAAATAAQREHVAGVLGVRLGSAPY
jgi:hypothetical protein